MNYDIRARLAKSIYDLLLIVIVAFAVSGAMMWFLGAELPAESCDVSCCVEKSTK